MTAGIIAREESSVTAEITATVKKTVTTERLVIIKSPVTAEKEEIPRTDPAMKPGLQERAGSPGNPVTTEKEEREETEAPAGLRVPARAAAENTAGETAAEAEATADSIRMISGEKKIPRQKPPGIIPERRKFRGRSHQG